VLDVRRGIADEVVALAQRAAQHTDLGLRAEGAAQKPVAVQPLQPPAVLNIALAARHVLDMAGIDQLHLEAPVLEDPIQRDPVDPRGLHGHRLNAAELQPVGQGIQIRRKAAEPAHGVLVPLFGNGHPVLARADVDARGMRVDHRKRGRGHGCTPFFRLNRTRSFHTVSPPVGDVDAHPARGWFVATLS